ncbi:MAG TPA: hypothetical protein VJZ50_05530 [Candidatus Limnocylindrales bacterium]|nr:hypothetical protein [Candidatus Limnocylindrales bacterium]
MDQGQEPPRGGTRPLDQELADRLAELEDRLRAIESVDLAGTSGRTLMSRIIPREARRHFRNGGRESLLGMRTIVDAWITRMDEKDEAGPSGTTRERIDIE